MAGAEQLYLDKARESLAGAESEYANRRYNNCANRCYYACFQAAIAALARIGVRPRAPGGEWGHAFVQREFAATLINRRKLYAPALRDTLPRTYALRQKADYSEDVVTQAQASRALRRTRELVQAVLAGEETS
jgi:uncharacterized protein (UPF0332 family)